MEKGKILLIIKGRKQVFYWDIFREEDMKRKTSIIIPKVIIAGLLAVYLTQFFQLGEKQTVQGEEIPSETEITEKSDSYSEKMKLRIDRAKESTKPTLIAADTEASRGENVTVMVSLVNNPGILGCSMTLSYDEAAVELEDVQRGNALGEDFELVLSNDLTSGCSLMWDAIDISEEGIQDGEILKLIFHVKEDAPYGKSPVVMICDTEGTVNRDISVVDLETENGYITVAS